MWKIEYFKKNKEDKKKVRATKIKLFPNLQGTSLLEIQSIYLEGVDSPGLYTKGAVHDFIKDGYTVFVWNSSSKCLAKISVNNEKYVSSTPNSTTADNLLKLPKI